MKLKPLLLSLLLVIIPIGIAYADYQDGWKAYKLKDFKTAFSEFKPLAESGHHQAQGHLGWMYYTGKGVKQDDKQAFKWIRKAVEKDRKAVEKDHALYQGVLGLMYKRGDGVKQDYKQAVYWYRKAAEQDGVWSQYLLGESYYHGQGVKQDYKQAVYWYRKAAEQGDASSQYRLGESYYYDKGVKQDYKQAVYWYRKAAEQGDEDAQLKLGRAYSMGLGVEKDYNKSLKWYKKAANQGSGLAKNNLTLLRVKLENIENEAKEEVAKEEKGRSYENATILLLESIMFLLLSILFLFILVTGSRRIKAYMAKSDEAYAISAAEVRKKAEEGARIKAKIEAKAEAEARIKAKIEAKVEAEARKKTEEEVRIKVEADEEEVRIKAEAAEEEARIKAEEEARIKAEEEKKLAKEKLNSDLINLHNSLPFYTRNKSDEFSSTNGDDSRWFFVLEAIKKCYTDDTTLYLVKIKSLNDDIEYYKIGVTTQSIASRFLKSTDSELVEIIASRIMEKRLALFAKFHFIREFRPKESPNEGEGFSGYTQIVKENSIRKIKSLFSTLPEYEAKASSFLTQALTDKS